MQFSNSCHVVLVTAGSHSRISPLTPHRPSHHTTAYLHNPLVHPYHAPFACAPWHSTCSMEAWKHPLTCPKLLPSSPVAFYFSCTCVHSSSAFRIFYLTSSSLSDLMHHLTCAAPPHASFPSAAFSPIPLPIQLSLSVLWTGVQLWSPCHGVGIGVVRSRN